MKGSEFFEKVDRDFVLDTVLAEETPVYLYFTSVIKSRLEAVRRCLSEEFDVYYAVKANPHLDVLSYLAANNVGADVASIGEYNLVVKAGIPTTRIEFSGPGKRESEISGALLSGVGSLNVESVPELLLVREIAKSAGVIAPVGIRINPGNKGRTSGLQMAGDTQFGFSLRDIPDAIEIIRSAPDCFAFRGLHAHVSSQEFSADVIAEHIRTTTELAATFSQTYGLPLRKINYGGGWGIDYFPNQTPLDLGKLRRLLREIPALQDVPEKIVEPGRYLVGESGLFVTKVLYKKRSSNRNFLITDGGMNANYLLAGGMGQVIRRNFEMTILSKRSNRAKGEFVYDIAGPLCTPQDVIARNFASDFQVEPGDFVVFFNCGAYGPSASPINFLGHDAPGETLIHNQS